MVKECIISVIVPIYNVEKYLERCILSIVKQTYKNLEIILVNDGSTDNSLLICEKWLKKDNRIKLYNKINGGLSDARNYGLTKASGEYISFVDSDDFIEEDMLEDLYKMIRKFDADIAETDFSIVDDYGYSKKKNKKMTILLNQHNAIIELCKGNIVENVVWNKLYKKTILKNIKFLFGKNSEDVVFNFEVLLNANKIIIDKTKSHYNYYIRENSIINSKVSKKTFDCVNNLIYIQNKIPKNFENYYNAKIIREKMKCINRVYKNTNDKEFNLVITNYLIDIKNYSFLEAYHYLSKKQFITLYLMKVSPYLYNILYKKYQKQ